MTRPTALRTDVADTVTRFVVDEFLPGTDPADLDADYDLVGSGVIDSLAILRVVGWLEDEFGLPVEDVELTAADFGSVSAMCRFVDRAGATPATT